MKVSIKAMRVNAGLNQKDAAKCLGVNQATLTSWELNKTYPDAGYLMSLCNLYGCTLDDIHIPSKLVKN